MYILIIRVIVIKLFEIEYIYIIVNRYDYLSNIFKCMRVFIKLIFKFFKQQKYLIQIDKFFFNLIYNNCDIVNIFFILIIDFKDVNLYFYLNEEIINFYIKINLKFFK